MKKQRVQDSDIGSNKCSKKAKPEIPAVIDNYNGECNPNLKKPEIPAVNLHDNCNVECNRNSKKQNDHDSDIGSNKTSKKKGKI